MISILWRYLLGQYLKVLFLCVTAFIAILLTTRLDEIAHFAALGATIPLILRYTLYQIPYILPIAVPISCLISTMILMQNLSDHHELSAFRSSGFSLREIITPILIGALLISFANFIVVSEMSTSSHLSANKLKMELRGVNPLLLLRNKHVMKMRGLYFDSLGPSRLGESASDFFIAMPNKQSNRIHLLFGKELTATQVGLEGKMITLVSSLDRTKDDLIKTEGFDHLMIENVQKLQTTADEFSHTLNKREWTMNNDHLHFSLLLVKLHEEKEALKKATAENKPLSELKQIKRSIQRCYAEMIRRLSVGLAAFTFTLMGCAYGMSVGRFRKSSRVFIVVGLAAMFMFSYFTARGIENLIVTASLLYLMPHVIISILSYRTLTRVAKGIE